MGPSKNEMQKDLLNPYSMELFQEYENMWYEYSHTEKMDKIRS